MPSAEDRNEGMLLSITWRSKNATRLAHVRSSRLGTRHELTRIAAQSGSKFASKVKEELDNSQCLEGQCTFPSGD
jgi:hypothetical protein